jgi:uncharacterized protein
MTATHMLLLAGASAAGGALNAVAGGGTFVTFPALLIAGVSPVPANATATFALWPAAAASAFAYRRDVAVSRQMGSILTLTSLVGGAIGAWLLLHTSNQSFEKMIPPLLLFASLIFTFSGWINSLIRRSVHAGRPQRGLLVSCAALQFAIAVYGGYFGAGIGILMIATWSALGFGSIHGINGLRSMLGMAINGVALLIFLATNTVEWLPGIIMAVSALATGYYGAWLARRVRPALVRRIVLVIAWFMTVYFFWKFYA